MIGKFIIKDIILLELDSKGDITQESSIVMIIVDTIVTIDGIIGVANNYAEDNVGVVNDSCT